MKIYNYTDFGEYVGESTAGTSPLDGLPLIPRNSTIIEPPARQDKKARVFNGTEWILVDDFRGETWYYHGTRNPIVIDFLGSIDTQIYQCNPQPHTEQEKWDIAREKRNGLLFESDWTQLLDSPVNREAWAEYRKILREIPQSFSDPDSIVWPSKPE